MERKPVIVYFLTDMLVISERDLSSSDLSLYKFIQLLELNEMSKCKDLEDNEHICNVFSLIAANGSVTFAADDNENKINFIKYLNNFNFFNK